MPLLDKSLTTVHPVAVATLASNGLIKNRPQ